jgi:hypothetical protein
MTFYRVALALFFLLLLGWNGMADTENSQQTTTSRIVFFVH